MVLIGVMAFSVAGCSPETKYRVLSFFFDGVPKPGEEQEAPPRPTEARPARPVPPPPVKAEEVPSVVSPEALPAAERSTRWEEIEPLLPKMAPGAMPDGRQEVDWMAALEDGVIQPRSSLDPKAPELQATDLDVRYEPKEGPEYVAVFRHGTHTRWMHCEICHPGIFEMQKGATPITMDRMMAGENCGACHGTVAFSIEPNCAVCHPALLGGR